MKSTKTTKIESNVEASRISKIVTVKVSKVASAANSLSVSSMLDSDASNEVELAFEVDNLEGESFDEEEFIKSVAASSLNDVIDDIEHLNSVSDDTIAKMQQAYEVFKEGMLEVSADAVWSPEIDLDNYQFPDDLIIDFDESPDVPSDEP